VGEDGKIVGLIALSTRTMRIIRLFGVGSPGIWTNAVFFPPL
jgi:hypothetical protein